MISRFFKAVGECLGCSDPEENSYLQFNDPHEIVIGNRTANFLGNIQIDKLNFNEIFEILSTYDDKINQNIYKQSSPENKIQTIEALATRTMILIPHPSVSIDTLRVLAEKLQNSEHLKDFMCMQRLVKQCEDRITELLGPRLR